ncbi:polyketide cyclase, partial [Mucilaginibacter sp. 5C4]|nr:polyketide cyclase [Mucilaginibacter sp. 5C4]
MNDTVMTIIGVFAGIIVVVLLLAAIAPKGYNIQRSIIINKPRQLVFDYVKYLRNMDNYSKWVMMDPNKRMTYTGTDGTEWYSAAWDSDMKQAGKGNQTIEAIVDG